MSVHKKSFSQAQRVGFEIINPRGRSMFMVLSREGLHAKGTLCWTRIDWSMKMGAIPRATDKKP